MRIADALTGYWLDKRINLSPRLLWPLLRRTERCHHLAVT